MSLKLRFSIFFSLLFSGILGFVLILIISLFSEFRRTEFIEKLKERSENTLRLLIEVQEVDHNMLKIIDRNTINTLYQEKILIFDLDHNLIYSSIDDEVIQWTTELLNEIYLKGEVYKSTDENEFLGLKRTFKGKDYLILAAANDKYGKRKLVFLQYTAFFAFLIALIIVWYLSFYLSKQALKPLDKFKSQITLISENNLNTPLELPKRENEITELSRIFNSMLERIRKSFSFQKNFINHASHELRTPISKVSLKVENMMMDKNSSPDVIKGLKSIKEDTDQMSEILSSLLLISNLNQKEINQKFRKIRLDEVIFDTIESVSYHLADLKVNFNINQSSAQDVHLEILGDESLLKIAFGNILKNAYKYSTDQQAIIEINQRNNQIEILISNNGNNPPENEIPKIFDPFYRSSNSIHIPGAGLGLSIVKRIFDFHGAEISFQITADKLNQVKIIFNSYL
jgi:signal transduction histidine kinase